MGRSGDEASFDAAFPELMVRAFRLAHRMLGDREAAEDVAADALAIALVRWRRVAGLPYRDAWVLRVTANLALKAAIRRSRSVGAADVDPIPVTRQFDDDTTLRVALVAALQTLPRRQREAVVLRYVTGLSEKEVADVLGVSPGTVKTHVHRGIDALRQHLGTRTEEVGLAAVCE